MAILKEYHHIWLEAHLGRDEDWLASRLKDGFDIHHIDGNHENNALGNLVLIEAVDHLRLLHGATRLTRIQRNSPKPSRAVKDLLVLFELGVIDAMYQQKLRNKAVKHIAADYGVTVGECKKLFTWFQRHKLQRPATAATMGPARKPVTKAPKKRGPKPNPGAFTSDELVAWDAHVRYNVMPRIQRQERETP